MVSGNLYTGKNRHEIKNKQMQSLNFKGEPTAYNGLGAEHIQKLPSHWKVAP